MTDRTPTTLFDCTCLPLNRRLLAHLLKVDEGSVHEQGCVERAVAEARAPLDGERLARALHNVSYGCQYPGRPSRADAIYHKGHAAAIAREYAALEDPTP